MASLRVLVQGKDRLDVGKIVRFVSDCRDAKLVIFHCSIRDVGVMEGLAKDLKGKLNVPYIGVRVSSTLINEGFIEDSVVVGVFSGKFKVKVFHENIDFHESDSMISSIESKLPDDGLVISYAACHLTEGVNLDYVLRKLNLKKPDVQFSGSLSAPSPIVFYNGGTFDRAILFCVLEGLDFDFKLESGLEFKKDSKEYTITKSDNYAVKEIDGVNAVTLYCGIKHLRPYFVNAIVNTATKPDAHKVLKLLSNTNEVIYKAIMRSTMELMGFITAEDIVEAMLILHFDEKNSEWLSQAFRPEGVRLQWVENDAKKILEIYDKINKWSRKSKFILGHECVLRLTFMNFRTKEIEEKAKKFEIPIMLSQTYGELGAYLPYTNLNTNVMHGGIIQILGFR